jgi:hypothetical protein
MQKNLASGPPMNLLPGGGAGSLDPVIRLYIGWGRKFIVVLDSDSEGEKQRNRYAAKFGPSVQNRVFTLGDLNPTWKGRSIEGLFEDNELLEVQQIAYPLATQFHKDHFCRAIQELLLTKQLINLSAATMQRFQDLINAAGAKLTALA